MKKFPTLALLVFIASTADATIWAVAPTPQAMNHWITVGQIGDQDTSVQNLYQSGSGQGYACYGLDNTTYGTGPFTCAEVPTPEVWGGPAIYSGSLNDDLSFLNLT
jgi:hypothetical protein